MKLKTKLFLSFSLIALVSASLGIFVSLLLYFQKIHHDAAADMEMLTRLTQHTVQDILLGAREDAATLSRNRALNMMLRYHFTEENFVDLLQKFLPDYALDAVAVYDAQGAFVARVAAKPGLALDFLRDTRAPPEERATLRFVQAQNGFYLQASAPILDQKTPLGTVVLLHHLNWRTHDRLVHKIAQLLRVEVALYLDRHEINRWGNLPSLAPEAFDALVQGRESHQLHLEMFAGGYIRDFIPLQDLDGQRVGVIGIGVPANRYVALTQQAYGVFLSLLVGCLIVAGLLGYALGRAILVPIGLLTDGVQRIIHDKDLSHRIQVEHDAQDELSVLASAFNRMTTRLHELVTNLEDVVETRTAEIVRLNERLKQENLRMGTELEIPRTIQRMVLPRGEELTRLAAYDIACVMEAAEQVGGDYYDILFHDQEDGRIKLGIGDVTGHGLESGLLMLMVQVAVRTLFIQGEPDPKQFLAILNQVIFHNIQRTGMDKNLTLALLDVDYHSGHTRVTGQHEEILLMRGNRLERLDTMDLGFWVGMEEDIAPYIACYETVLNPGDGLILFTDGITEAFNRRGEQYGLDRFCQQVEDYWHLPAEQLQEHLIEDLKGFASDFQDDITLVIVKRR